MQLYSQCPRYVIIEKILFGAALGITLAEIFVFSVRKTEMKGEK